MYGFVAGDNYARLRDVQRTVIFGPTTLMVLVNDTTAPPAPTWSPAPTGTWTQPTTLIDNAFRVRQLHVADHDDAVHVGGGRRV